MIPQFNISYFDLVYTQDESVYMPQKESEESEISTNQGGTRMTMRFGRDNRIVYKHVPNDQLVDSRDFMQKQFLIKGPLTPRKWKIGTGKKEILGYTCMDATFQADSATHIRAWFSPQIPVFNGPSDYQGLPGMILQIDINDGERMTTATKLTSDNIDTAEIQAPEKGKEVTAEEFEKIREEKLKEMRVMNPSGGHHMIITRRN